MTAMAKLRTCIVEGCGATVTPDKRRSGMCHEHATAAYSARKDREVPIDTPRSRAEDFVLAWRVGDYERDDVDPSFMSERSVEGLIARVADLLGGQTLPPPMPASDTPAGRQLARGVVKPGTPRQASPDVASEPNVRAAGCAAYTVCAALAAKKGWAAWTCRGCGGPGVTKVRGIAEHNPERSDSNVMTGRDGVPWG